MVTRIAAAIFKEKVLPKVSLSIALVHYPVLNKRGETITSALTNLDLHDIARTAKTYGLQNFFVVTPLRDQKELARRIVNHWTEGFGARYNPKRKQALDLIRIVDSLGAAVEKLRMEKGKTPRIVATSARETNRSIGFDRFGKMIRTDCEYILVFGTAWGLCPEFIETVDYMLEPVMGTTGYNHLSVRCASAIILDRIFRP